MIVYTCTEEMGLGKVLPSEVKTWFLASNLEKEILKSLLTLTMTIFRNNEKFCSFPAGLSISIFTQNKFQFSFKKLRLVSKKETCYKSHSTYELELRILDFEGGRKRQKKMERKRERHRETEIKFLLVVWFNRDAKFFQVIRS